MMSSQKRQPDEGKPRAEGNTSPEEKRRKFSFRSVVEEVMKMQPVQQYLEPILEPLIRRVVREEVELALKKHLASMKWKNGKEIDSAESRSLKLKFSNSLSLPVFTGARIEGEECSAIKLLLLDTLTGEIVDSGPESSARAEIVVLEGDFDSDEGDNWTPDEFKNNIVRERDGKKPLLTGDVLLNLKEGIGLVGEISFTDNSSWTRSRKFRLGARVLDNLDGIGIKEAKTESFIVRDHRGELYKKHYPPNLFDEVWRLEKIGKDGAFHKRLSRENIHTVKDFLILLFLDPSRLRHILGTGMSAKMWEVTVDHARTCIIDKRVYLYFLAGSQQKTGVVFDVVGQIIGLLSDCQYVTNDKLPETEKADAQNLVIDAFKHWPEVISFDDEASLLQGLSHLSNIPCTSISARTENSDGKKLSGSQKMSAFDHAQPNPSSPDIISSMYSVGGVSGLDDYALHGIGNMAIRYDHTLSFTDQVSNSLLCDAGSMAQAFCDEDHLPFFDTDLPSQSLGLESQTELHTALDNFLIARSAAFAKAQSQMRWTKIFSVFKWLCIRRYVLEKPSCLPRIHRH